MSEIFEGDFVRFRGHRLQVHYQTCWWKVTAVTETHVELVDRTGHTGRLRRNARYQHCRALVWEPGDNRNDD
jgi:hypothetical protein